MTRRLLLVEPSDTMRHVLEKHARALGHEIVSTGSYREASGVLDRQFRAFETDIAGVIHGWPSLADADAAAFAERLGSVELADLPVVVMSTDMRAETRAWVAGRDRTAVLAWRDYLGIDALLERLLDDGAERAGALRVTRQDNADFHILIVDDSLAIRYALRDLFDGQGYRVGLAATANEALAAARSTRFDLAVLDFYLEETTGDALCRDLVTDPRCGDVVCTILTGTYADHVIKRGLRAGAVECMFKHESSELLLTRIEAIARLVRQRRQLASQTLALSRAIETLTGAALIVDERERLQHATGAALSELGLVSVATALGRPVCELLGVSALPTDDSPHPMNWRDATGGTFAVSVTRRELPGAGGTLIRFERMTRGEALPGPSSDPSSDAGRPSSPPILRAVSAAPVGVGGATRRPAPSIVERFGLPASAGPFVDRLSRYVDAADTRAEPVSLLVLGLFERGGDGRFLPIESSHEHGAQVASGIRKLYRREHHVAALGAHRHAMLIRHVDEPQSFLLTRRLMQLCNELLVADGGPTLASTGCLVRVVAHDARGPARILEHALQGLDIVDARGKDQALLLDLRRMLTVYPATSAPASVRD